METPTGTGNFSYGGVLGDALQISWRKRYLWLLGLIAAAVSSLSTAFSSLSSLFQPDATTGQIPAFIQNNLVTLGVVGVIVFLVVLVVGIFLSVVCNGGLVSAVSDEDRGSGSSFGAGWRSGVAVFWRLLFQTILLVLLAIALMLIPVVICGLPVLLTFLLSESVGLRIFVAVVFSLLFILLLFAIFIPFGALSNFAVRDLILNRGGIAGSISAGYRMFRANFGRSIVLALINFGLSIVVGVVFWVIGFIINLIFIGPSIGLSVSGSESAATAAGVAGQLLALVPTTLLSALTVVFFSAFWTIAYLRISSGSLGER